MKKVVQLLFLILINGDISAGFANNRSLVNEFFGFVICPFI